MKRIYLGLFCLALSIGTTETTLASSISEVEINDTLATAQDIEGAFTADYDPEVINSGVSGWETVSISGTGRSNTPKIPGDFDYYSFYASAGQSYYFDIDHGAEWVNGVRGEGWVASEINVWDTQGNFLFIQNGCSTVNGVLQDCSINNYDLGSNDWLDSLAFWTFEKSGTYVIRVSESYSYDAHGDYTKGNGLEAGDTYELQISRGIGNPSPNNPVPEPSAILLFSIGMLGMTGISRKRKA
jgi:hypothetical protein